MISNSTYKKIILIAFIGMALFQWAVPLSMIFTKEQTSEKGKKFKFELTGIDPHDPFRGKYLILNPVENSFQIPLNVITAKNMNATFEEGQDGYAKIKWMGTDKPEDDNFLNLATYQQGVNPEHRKMRVRYPFDKFFINENKVKAAEKILLAAIGDDDQEAYALVSIYKGQYKLEDLIINGVAILEQLN